MRKALLGGLAAAALAGAAQAQVIAEWVLAGAPGDQPSTPASGTPASVSGLDMTRGAGINPSSAANSFSGTSWHTLAADDYFSIGFTVDPGWSVALDELWIGTRSSNTGPGFLGLFHSGDGFSTSLYTFVQTGTNVTNSVIDLSVLGTLSGTVELRVMSLNNSSAGGGTVGSTGAFRFVENGSGPTPVPVRLTGSVFPSAGLGTPYCFGDGSSSACPCANLGGSGQGCANSTGQGATLVAGGSPSVGAGDLVLAGANLPAGLACVFFQGDAALNGGGGLPFGDGLRCVGGGTVRLQVVSADAGGQASSTTNLAVAGGATAGSSKHYQLWYQDHASGPCGSRANLTHALALTWVP